MFAVYTLFFIIVNEQHSKKRLGTRVKYKHVRSYNRRTRFPSGSHLEEWRKNEIESIQHLTLSERVTCT